MKVAPARAIIAALALVTVLMHARVASPQLLSPGPLSKAHASIEGDQHCNECHSSGKRVDAGACLKCHADLGARISAGQGLHGLQYRGKPCEQCHVEHLGAPALMRWPGGDPSKLDHAQTGWPLDGAHKATPCGNCHSNHNARGNPTFLGLSSSCTPCHKDQHDGRLGKSCVNCHDETAWKDLNLKDFNHDLARFPLRGAHQTVPCAKCHFVSNGSATYVNLKFAQCTDCHKDPHAGRLGPSCKDCHEDTRWKPVTFTHLAAKHPGTSLANGHASVACQACHDRGNLVSPSKGTECVSCHQPVHKAPFGRACASCHATILWVGLPPAVGLAAHPRTDYPLTGAHESVRCAGCHKPEVPRDARFRKVAFARCDDCHADQHRGEFAKADGGECRPCHTTSGFSPTLFGLEAHTSTRFALVGGHIATPCQSCHTAARPRFDLRLAKQACADCHANPHGDQFAKEMAQGGCGHCHEPTGWSLPKIDHSIWPLTGAHATAQCDSCHHPTAEDRKAGRGASYRGVPRECGGCHDDVHLGQFRLAAPVLACDRCHTTKVFKIPSFDHVAVTGWALTGAHAPLDCEKCHPMAKVGGDQATRRWRLPSTDCKFCHANPHERRGASI
jgi:Cytochrome c7 and related cytochrome c